METEGYFLLIFLVLFQSINQNKAIHATLGNECLPEDTHNSSPSLFQLKYTVNFKELI